MRYWLFGLCCLLGWSSTVVATELRMSQRTDVHGFILRMVSQNKFSRSYLEDVFDRTHLQVSIIKRMQTPFEHQRWSIYRRHFITPGRVRQGVVFWQQHQRSLAKAEQRFHVPAAIIVAILGIETKYGTAQGKFSILDALATLAFNYPPRAKFFASELQQYLLLARELGFNPHTWRGSYAGAIGYPQFMPSSYRQYAIDFSGSGKRDLTRSADDAIGSVANYLAKHGWHAQQPIAVKADIHGQSYRQLVFNLLKPHYTLGQLRQYGIQPSQPLTAPEKVSLLSYHNGKQEEFWIGCHNFFVLTRYNVSKQYVRAVLELSEALAIKFSPHASSESRA